MKNPLKIITILLVFAIYSTPIFSQTKVTKTKISGYIKDSNGNIIKDAVFFIDEVKTKATINNYGSYKLKVNSDTKKIKAFSYSRGIIEIDYKGQKKIDFIYNNYSPSATPKVVEKRDSDTFEYKDVFEMIRAKVPGVRVQSDNTILIRGTTSFNGSTAPLFVVNGTPVSSIDNISPQFVDKISVLKGPETAIYGVRGSNGVILITLKKKI